VVSQRLLPRATGRGLVAAYEVITGGPPLWGLIRDRKLHQLPSLLQRGKAFGMRRLEESLRDLMGAGDISEEIAVKNAEDPRVLSASASPGAESWNPRFGGA
jgi:twitching motility protein PilT